MYWTPSDIEWASRWDAYLAMPNGSVHWFSILNSLLVVLVMSVIVAVILMRTVRRDLAKYEELLVEGQARPFVPRTSLFLVRLLFDGAAGRWRCPALHSASHLGGRNPRTASPLPYGALHSE